MTLFVFEAVVGRFVLFAAGLWLLFGMGILLSMKRAIIPAGVPLLVRITAALVTIVFAPYIALRTGAIPRSMMVVKNDADGNPECPCPECQARREAGHGA